VKKGLILIIAIMLIAVVVLGACSKATPTTTTAPATTSAKPTTTAPAPTTTTTAPKPTTTAATTTTGQPKKGGVLRLSRFTNEGVSLGDPLNHRGMNSWWQSSECLETLLRTGASGELIPWLATAWKEDVATKSLTLTIRQGVKFQDGTPLNAEAVRWNMQYRMDGKMPAYASFAKVETVDSNTVKITFKTWDSTVIYNLASGPGLIISPDNYLINGAAYAADHPVGTGPFKFVSWQKNNKITFARWDGYWQPGKPYLDGIEWYTIPDMNTKVMSFINGELEVVLTLDLSQVQMAEKAGYKPYLQPVSGGADGFIPSSANTSSPWNNVKVRQAAAYAINVNEYETALFGELGTSSNNQFVPKGNWAYNPNVVGYPYNPDKAKQLLTEAGYPNGFKTPFLGFPDATMNNRVLTIAQYLGKVGITSDIQIISSAELTDRQTNGFGWNGLIWNSLGQSMDVTDTLNRYYAASNMNFVSMLKPADWVQGIADAVAAPDFTTKQKVVQNLMSLVSDKYCLMLLQGTRLDDEFEQKYVHDTGITRTPNTQMWTPEDAWMDK
jgi:peptide/nickel transport system substrate-binding protein